MRGVTLALLLVLSGLQFMLWVGDGSIAEVWYLREAIAAQQTENEQLRERNARLVAQALDLKAGHQAIERRARRELGMVGPGETFFQFIEGK